MFICINQLFIEQWTEGKKHPILSDRTLWWIYFEHYHIKLVAFGPSIKH